MVAVGLLGAAIGGRARWLVPASFLAVLAASAAAAVAGAALPAAEVGIVTSVVVLVLVAGLRLRPPVGVATALGGSFAAFHGTAHGAEMPADASGLAYSAGVLLATAALHAIGLGLGTLLDRVVGRTPPGRVQA